MTHQKSRIISIIIVAVMFFSLAFTVGIQNVNAATENKSFTVNSKTINISKNEMKQYDALAKSIATALSKNKDGKYEKAISNYVSKNNTAIQKAIIERIGDASYKATKVRDANIIISPDFEKTLKRTYSFSNAVITVTPFEICVNKTDKNKANTKKKTKVRYYSESQTYYSWVGIKLFTVGLECNYNYNGKKAWYHSGFDGWYYRGKFSIWQVSNWKERREKSGTNYVAWVAGNFHYGIEYKGVGWIVCDRYIKHSATCNKSGKVTLKKTDLRK